MDKWDFEIKCFPCDGLSPTYVRLAYTERCPDRFKVQHQLTNDIYEIGEMSAEDAWKFVMSIRDY